MRRRSVLPNQGLVFPGSYYFPIEKSYTHMFINGNLFKPYHCIQVVQPLLPCRLATLPHYYNVMRIVKYTGLLSLVVV